jgi:hypothetical protein
MVTHLRKRRNYRSKTVFSPSSFVEPQIELDAVSSVFFLLGLAPCSSKIVQQCRGDKVQ